MAAGRAAYVPGAAVDAETAETCSARSRLHRSGDPAGDDQVRHGRLRRVLSRSARLQRLQRRPIADPGRLQPGRLHASH